MVAWLVLGCHHEPPPPADPGRVLDGPLLGRGIAAVPGSLWVTAPDVDGTGAALLLDGIALAPAATIAGSAAAPLGDAVARCPDLDGDGREDVILGAPTVGDLGGAWWVSDPRDAVELATALFVSGFREDGHAGTMVACGDLDGDGTSDMAMSAPDSDGIGLASFGGTVEVYQGDGGAPDKVALMESTWDRAHLGFRSSLTLHDDLDGDGVDDLVVGGYGADQVNIGFGPMAGNSDQNTMQTLQGIDDQGTGYSVATGDVTGDGQVDLLVGAPLAYGSQGAVWVVAGPFDRDDKLIITVGHQIQGAGISDQAGFSLAVVGDVDGDGAEDWLTGAPTSGGVGPEAGAAYLVLGDGADLVDLDYSDAIFVGDVALGHLGWSVAGADLDGDGAIELVIGAPERDIGHTLGAGSVFVFDGSVRETVQVEQARAQVDGTSL